VIQDKLGGKAWGYIAEIQHDVSGSSIGIEFAAKNASGINGTMTPYLGAAGVFGAWFAGGGDDAFGGAPTDPSNAAIVILKNAHTWNTGIVFKSDAITGNDGTAAATGNVPAIRLGRRQMIQWDEPTTGQRAAFINCAITNSDSRMLAEFTNGAFTIKGGLNNNAVASFANTNVDAVNSLSISNNVSGAAPFMSTAGADANIDLRLLPKGSGVVRFGTWTDLGGGNGYIPIKDSAGTVRNLATGLYAGRNWQAMTASLGAGAGIEDFEMTVTDPNCDTTSVVEVRLAATTDADENEPEFVDVKSMIARPATGSFTLSLALADRHSGPLKLQYRIN
jgi:hypothetical protein